MGGRGIYQASKLSIFPVRSDTFPDTSGRKLAADGGFYGKNADFQAV